jgi:hypothetical protein
VCHFEDGKVYARGLCSWHYHRFLKGRPLEPPKRHEGRTRVLTADDVEQIRQLRAKPGYQHQELAEMFGVSESAISHIFTGRTWSRTD